MLGLNVHVEACLGNNVELRKKCKRFRTFYGMCRVYERSRPTRVTELNNRLSALKPREILTRLETSQIFRVVCRLS